MCYIINVKRHRASKDRGEHIMKFKYFKADHLTTIEEAKRQYHKLCVKLHPDMGGSYEEFVAMGAEWEYLQKHNYNIHETAEGSTYTDWNQETPDEVTSKFADIIEQLIHMEGVEIEICGSFIWLGGNTYNHKAEIKGMGFRWAPKKKRWYLAPKDWKKKGHRELTMGEIREAYGSQRVATASRLALTA